MIWKYFYILIMAYLLTSCQQKKDISSKSESYAKPSYTDLTEDKTQVSFHFTDITKSAGINFKHETGAFGKKWMPETTGSGIGLFDYNNDGLVDIFLVNSSFWKGHKKSGPRPTQMLYKNLDNRKFEDVTAELGLDISLYGMGCTMADYDSDGDLDIYITAVGDNKLLRNDNSRFTDVTSSLNVTGSSTEAGIPPAWSTSAAWVDIDRDGWLDLFVCNYVVWTPETDLYTTLDGKTKSYATPQQYEGETCRLYKNIKGKEFKDITKSAGVYNAEGKSLGIAVYDFNEDNWMDLVITNDTQPNFLYMNNCDGTFTDKGLQSGIAFDEFGRARAGMGVDIASISNDHNQSIAIGNFSKEPISLFTTIQPDIFLDYAGRARISKPSLLSLSFGILFNDMDLDGYMDLLVTNGHIEPEINRIQQEITFAQSSQLFLNNRKGGFTEITNQVGEAFSKPIVGRGLATADIDNDGDADLIISENGGMARLLRNDLDVANKNWIKIQMKGKSPNLNALGARVTLWYNEMQQTKMIRTGSSYLSQSDISELIFGIGENTSVDSIQIRWPVTGKIEKLGLLQSGKTHLFKEN